MKKLVALVVLAGCLAAGAAEPWKVRAVQLDLGRQKETVPFLKAFAEKIAAAGYNTYVLYLEGRVKTASTPFFKDEDCYTPAEMREVVEHATKCGLDCVPVVSILGHANLFTRYAEVKPLAEGRANKGWVGATFCLSKPETRAFLETYIAEVAAIFPSKNFHMGFDEAWDMGTCELCAPVRKAKGMGPLFTEFVKFAHGLAVKNGKRMWMWDDLYEFFPEELANCPKDIVMCNWKYEPVSQWGIRARFADSERVDWMSKYAAYGIECLASCGSKRDSIRTFTDYARPHLNCLGGFTTLWEMSAMNHGIRFPLVLGAGLYWTEGWNDPAFDFVTAGAKAAFPSLTGDELRAVATLLEEQGRDHIVPPRARVGANLQGMMRPQGPAADDLAVSILKKSALHPGSGEIAAEPLSEAALLDDLVTYVEFCRFRDLFREVEPMLMNPRRSVSQILSAKAKLRAAEPEIRRVCERRWAQRNAWRGDMRPWEFPGADWGKKYVEELLATPERTAEPDEWWLVANVNLPDWFGNLTLYVYGLFDGEWKRLAVGDWKPGTADECCFEAVTPFKSKTAPTALKIASESGVGICGLNYISCFNNRQRLVPAEVTATSGFMKDAEKILVDNLYPAVFGVPDRKGDAFHRDGRRSCVGTLEISLKSDFEPLTPVRVTTAAWQAKIDAASAAGGGTVTLPPGRHTVGTLFLKSGVTLEIPKGCVLEGSSNTADYPAVPVAYAELREPWQGLIVAEGQQDIAVVGEGEIFGNGGAFPHGTRLGRPRGFLLQRCRNVRIEGVFLHDLASWTCYLKECDGVVVRGVRVDSHANDNNDGIDIDSKNVLVEDCSFDSDDDGIVLKSDNADFIVENVTVRNCKVRSTCSAIKLGTGSHGGFRNILFENIEGKASERQYCNAKGVPLIAAYRVETWPGSTMDPSFLSGIALECVDGAVLENVTVRNVTVDRAASPIFIRGGLRYGRLFGNAVPLALPFGHHKVLRNVLIENFKAKATSFTASSITGVPGLRLADITLRNVEIEVPGAGDAAKAEIGRPVPEKADKYPESNMFDHRMLPAYGLYARHVDGLKLENVVITAKGPDPREKFVFDDVTQK